MKRASKRKIVWATIKLLLTLLLIQTIWFIFGNSLEVGQVQAQKSQAVLKYYNVMAQENSLPQLTHYQVRKLAHFLEYCMEGFIATLWLDQFTQRYIRYISWPMLLQIVTALTDETIQVFTESRQSSVIDVWIDFCGGMFGIVTCVVLLLFIKLIIHTASDITHRWRILQT